MDKLDELALKVRKSKDKDAYDAVTTFVAGVNHVFRLAYRAATLVSLLHERPEWKLDAALRDGRMELEEIASPTSDGFAQSGGWGPPGRKDKTER